MKKKTKQKLIGLGLIALSILSFFIDYDITVCVVFLPIGLGLLFSKNIVID